MWFLKSNRFSNWVILFFSYGNTMYNTKYNNIIYLYLFLFRINLNNLNLLTFNLLTQVFRPKHPYLD